MYLPKRTVRVVKIGVIAGDPHIAVDAPEHLPESRKSDLPIGPFVKFPTVNVIGETALIVHKHPDPAVGFNGDERHLVGDDGALGADRTQRNEAILPVTVHADPFIGPDPEIALRIFNNRINEIGVKAHFRHSVHLERISVIAVQALVGSDPDEAPGVLHDGADSVIGEAVVVLGQVGEFVTPNPDGEQQSEQRQRHKKRADHAT